MVDSLCQRYQGLNPFLVNQIAFGEVIELYADLVKKTKRDNKKEKSEEWVYASDDAGWW